MRLADPKILSGFLSKHDLKPRKGLGQHYLCSQKAVDAIVGRLADCKGILEIGPGPGVLTSAFSVKVIALEVDPRMVLALSESSPKADVRLLDALEADLAGILSELPAPRAVVSNLPYFITGALMNRIAAVWPQWDRAVLMMQKEVGERIVAIPGNSDRGSLSVYLQSRFQINRVGLVPAGAFLPPPKVDSVVLEFIPKNFEPGELYDRLVRLGFTQPRKTLANNLQPDHEKSLIEAVLAEMGLDSRVRPHSLTLEHWLDLSQRLR